MIDLVPNGATFDEVVQLAKEIEAAGEAGTANERLTTPEQALGFPILRLDRAQRLGGLQPARG